MNADEWATEVRDYKKIDKLNKLTNLDTFWDDCRKLTANVRSDHGIKRWQCLAEGRYKELICGHELTPKDIWNKTFGELSQKSLAKDSTLAQKVDRTAQKER